MHAPAAYIVINGPGHEGTTLPLREGITSLGRLPSNDVILLGDLVSRHHSRVLYFDGRASIQDLGSHNGTWVNGERVSTRPMNPGDVVRVGNFRIGFHTGEPVAVAAPDPEPTDEYPDANDTMSPGPRVFETSDLLPDSVSTRDPGRSGWLQTISPAARGSAAPATEAARWKQMFEVSHLLLEATNATACLQTIAERMIESLDAVVVVFYRSVPGAAEAEVIAACGAGVEDPNQLPVSRSVLRWAIAKNFTVFSKDLSKDLRFTGASAMMMSDELRALVCAPLATDENAIGALYVSRSAAMPFTDADVDGIEAIAYLVAAGVRRFERHVEAKASDANSEALARFCPPDVVQRLVSDGVKPGLDGRTGTVCFCDIQGFTGLAERLNADQVADLLDAYLDRMTTVVFRHHGSIVKLVGDGLVAVFGAPYSFGNDALEAVRAATEMRRAFDQLVASRPSVGPRRLRFGIETGWVLTGLLGAADRLQYTVVGETVATASRIQTSVAAGAIVVGAETEQLIRNHVRLEDAGLLQVQGRRTSLHLFEVVTGSSRPHRV